MDYKLQRNISLDKVCVLYVITADSTEKQGTRCYVFGFIEGWLTFLPKTVHRNKLPALSHSDFMSIFLSILCYISIRIKAEQLFDALVYSSHFRY